MREFQSNRREFPIHARRGIPDQGRWRFLIGIFPQGAEQSVSGNSATPRLFVGKFQCIQNEFPLLHNISGPERRAVIWDNVPTAYCLGKKKGYMLMEKINKKPSPLRGHLIFQKTREETCLVFSFRVSVSKCLPLTFFSIFPLLTARRGEIKHLRAVDSATRPIVLGLL